MEKHVAKDLTSSLSTLKNILEKQLLPIVIRIKQNIRKIIAAMNMTLVTPKQTKLIRLFPRQNIFEKKFAKLNDCTYICNRLVSQ